MISKHISYEESIKSNTASRLGIDNTPDDFELHHMSDVALHLFEPLREWVGGPIKVNSFFRCESLNTSIGGSKTSQHMKGQAIDKDDTFGHKTNGEMYHYIKDNLDFDQMVWEFGTEDNPNWLHISWVSHRPNRKKLTVALKRRGKTVYENRSI